MKNHTHWVGTTASGKPARIVYEEPGPYVWRLYVGEGTHHLYAFHYLWAAKDCGTSMKDPVTVWKKGPKNDAR